MTLAPHRSSASLMSAPSTQSRCTRLYGSCAEEGAGSPFARATRPASATRSAGQLTIPHARARPAAISSPIMPTTSSIGTSAGGGSLSR
jgi:hypothetical protein